jgi:hypothetical protein|tara:strand:+ start:3875 stop:4816 length:942 start_codon:yes stop_codon:yes gene_type:complete
MSKHSFAGTSIYNKGAGRRLETTVFYYAKVVSNQDELGASRIKARIVGVDDAIALNALPFAFPMLQKQLHVVPKINETVLIFIPDVKNPNIDRMYMGPIISQPQFLYKDSNIFSAKSTLSSGIKEAQPSPFTIPENRGVYPNVEDIALQGRDNSDIVLKEKEVLIRAGQFDSSVSRGEIPKFNKVNPSYIQVKHGVTLTPETESSTSEVGGVINVVSNKINLITHKNGSPRFILNDQDNNIADKEIQKIIKEAHPLVFGDNLIEFLQVLIDAFINHVHAYPGLKPQDVSGANDIDKLLEFDLESFLSKNIKIN